MATTKMYLDCRASRIDGSAPLKINISHNNASALISIDTYIMPTQWDKVSGKVVSHPNKQSLNNYIARRKIDVDNEIMKLAESGSISGMTASKIKNAVLTVLNPCKIPATTFVSEYKKFIESKEKPRTREIYQMTLNWILRYDTKAEQLAFEEITKDWLVGFDKFLLVQSHCLETLVTFISVISELCLMQVDKI